MFDARRKLRAALVAKELWRRTCEHQSSFDRFLQTDPRDVGCGEAMEILHVYVELVAADAAAEERYPGIAAHLKAVALAQRLTGLLAAIEGSDVLR